MIFDRKIANIIEKWLDEKEIIILTGPRQVGKTTLLKILTEKLKRKNVSDDRIFYLNLEELNILSALNENPENLLDYITVKNARNYFFIDEIQYLDKPSNFLKHIYDKYADQIKLIATGSSNLEIKAKFQDSLAGRKATFGISPLDFEEFLKFKNFSQQRYLRQPELPPDIRHSFDRALEEYLIYGGLPAVVLQGDKAKKEKLLNEYAGAYINQDIRAFGQVDNIGDFNRVVKMLAGQIGNLLNVNELGNTAGVSRRNILKYLELLEYTYVFRKIAPYTANVRAQVTKMPKFYFFDTGVRNALLENFLGLDSRADAGALFENFVFTALDKDRNIYFYRSAGQSEIDFVVEKPEALCLIEVKYKKLNKRINERVLLNFPAKNKFGRKIYVINLSYNFKPDAGAEYLDYRFADYL